MTPSRLDRALFLAGLTVLCVWTLVPIYILALGALGGRDIVSQCHAQTAALHRAGEPVTNLAGEPGFNPVEVRRP